MSLVCFSPARIHVSPLTGRALSIEYLLGCGVPSEIVSRVPHFIRIVVVQARSKFKLAMHDDNAHAQNHMASEPTMSFGKLALQVHRVLLRRCSLWKQIAPRLLSYSCLNRASTNVSGGPGLKEFIVPGSLPTPAEDRTPLAPYLEENHISGRGRKGECKPLNAVCPNTDKDGRCVLLYFSSQCIWQIYGCQMNVNDADIAWTFLSEAGYQRTDDVEVTIWDISHDVKVNLNSVHKHL